MHFIFNIYPHSSVHTVFLIWLPLFNHVYTYTFCRDRPTYITYALDRITQIHLALLLICLGVHIVFGGSYVYPSQ
jgi:hypothetical protein